MRILYLTSNFKIILFLNLIIKCNHLRNHDLTDNSNEDKDTYEFSFQSADYVKENELLD